MKGHFFVLEGIDGCGKTSQINNLAGWLPKSGLMPESSKLHITREPGGTALGSALRQLLLHPPNEQAPKPLTELLLYAADRAQHVSQFILPALEKGDWVISDRFSGSTLAYQGFGRSISLDIINKLELIATQGLLPDITFWLDVSVKESLRRRGEMPEDRIEAEGVNFLVKVASGFAELSRQRNWIHLPAETDPVSLSDEIKKEICSYFSKVNEKNL